MASKIRLTNIPEPSAQELFFYSAIRRHKQSAMQERKEWGQHAAMYRGDEFAMHDGTDDTIHEDIEEGGVEDITAEANYLYAFADTQAAQVVPNNPKVDVIATRSALRKAAKYRSSLINEVLSLEKMHSKLWQLVIRSTIYPRSFIKVEWSAAKQRPTIRVRRPHVIWFDDTADSWDEIKYIIEMQAITIGEFQARVKSRKKGDASKRVYDPRVASAVEGTAGFPDLLRNQDDDGNKSQDTKPSQEHYRWVLIYEVYDFVGGNFYHYADGVHKPLLATSLPYKLFKNPFIPLVFNDNLKDIGGLSDAKLVAPTIQRLNEMAALRVWHTKASIPAVVLHGGLVDDPGEFEDAYESLDGPGQYLLLDAVARARIGDVLGQTPVPNMPIEWQSVMDNLQQIIEFVLALPAVARGQVGQSDVATELALADSATKTRNSRRQLAVYDVLEATAERIVGLYTEFMDDDAWIAAEISDDYGDDVLLTRETMRLPRRGSDNPWAYRYKAQPYDGQRENSVVQLKAILETVDLLYNNPHVDQRKFTEQLLSLLKLSNLMTTPEQAKALMQAAEAAEAGEAGEAQGSTPDMAALPGMPPEMAAASSGGQVMAGSGEMAVPGGLQGGSVPAA
jgi:hypothetical protein